ncbi:MAG: 30S ribosomal protein S8 [Nanoarchaeota archaeon]
MLHDPLATALSNIWNAEKVGKTQCIAKPSSRVIKSVLGILHNNGYIGDFEEIADGGKNLLRINLLGKVNKCSVIKPRYPVKYTDLEKYEKRYLPAKDFGILIISASKGLITHIDARNSKTGGRLIAYCY